MNRLDGDLEETLTSIIDRTPEEFSMTLSSNSIPEDIIKKLHSKIEALHKASVEKKQSEAEVDASNENIPQLDPQIALKRLAI